MSLTDKKVVVLGAGRSGIAAAHLAHAQGATVCLFDGNAKARPESLRAEIDFVAEADETTGQEVASDLLVISPGIDTYGSFVRAFSQKTKELIGELELAWRYFKGTGIAITGTNGKTTTTELISHLINKSGNVARPCGNHGQPLSELVLEGFSDYAVIEVSSFQLETIKTFNPQLAIWLNFAPDHMDRYKSLEDYRNAKARIFEYLSNEQFKITRLEEGFQFSEHHLTFSSDSTQSDFTLHSGVIKLNSGQEVDLSSTKLRGSHNAENAMAAIACIDCLKLEIPSYEAALADFTPPEHRCELVAKIGGIEFINDSKSTNIHSLETALNAFNQKLVLIIGGKEKGLDYTPLLPQLEGQVTSIVTIGEIGKELSSLFSKKLPTFFEETLPEAVQKAASLAEAGDLVLFSPGTSSFDQFKSYQERGEQFKNAVNQLQTPFN